MFRTLTLLTASAWFAAASVLAQTTPVLTSLRSFNGVNGQYPEYGLTPGPDGDFYGITSEGGANGEGTFFRVAPDGTLTLLHSFDATADGGTPRCTLVLASDGNFYGTATTGGPSGDGTVFQATPGGTLTILHAFNYNNTAAGEAPVGGLVQGRDGFLYGTTSFGGDSSNDGILFRVGLDGTFTSLHAFDFHQTGTGPRDPESALVQGSDGNFYGVASGGDNNLGSVYQLTPAGVVTTLHSFGKSDGFAPVGPLVEGSPGVFYGLTAGGGGASGNGIGTIFKITAGGQLTTLHVFTSGDGTGVGVTTGFILGTDGNLYTTTMSGARGYGNILRCTPVGVVTSLYGFNANTSASGYYPYGGVTQASDGSFYGLTAEGGPSNYGVVYHLTFDPHPPFFDGQVALSNSVEYLQFASGNPFGYYSFLTDPHYIYHFDLGYEYVFDAGDGYDGVYLYDFRSSDFFYTSPIFPFPYLYDFNLGTVLYYYPDPKNAGRYNTNGIRYFYNFATGKVITK